MSMQKIPLTDLEREGLAKHGLPVEGTCQVSDAFRLGMRWALLDRRAPHIQKYAACGLRQQARALTVLSVGQLSQLEGVVLVNEGTRYFLEAQESYRVILACDSPGKVVGTGVLGQLNNLTVITDQFLPRHLRFIQTPLLIESDRVRFLQISADPT